MQPGQSVEYPFETAALQVDMEEAPDDLSKRHRPDCQMDGGGPDGMLGGPGVVVEVDECHLHSRKYHRGAELASEKVCAVGVIERSTNDLGGRKAAFLSRLKEVRTNWSRSFESGSGQVPYW